MVSLLGGLGRQNWAIIEGQSDYFVNLESFRKVYIKDENVAIIKLGYRKKSKCSKVI